MLTVAEISCIVTIHSNNDILVFGAYVVDGDVFKPAYRYKMQGCPHNICDKEP